MDSLSNIVANTLVPHAAFNEASKRIEQCMKYAMGSSEPICIAVIGQSRTGKSRVIEQFYRQHPSVRTKEGLRVPVLLVRTPAKPTVKGLVELMLRAMGDPRFDIGTANAKTIRLKVLMKNAGTYMVIIEEFQHFYDKGLHAVMHEVADWLKILVDDTKCALLVAGLPSCCTVLDQNEQLAGRFSAPIIMPRFKWESEKDRAEFRKILTSFQVSISQYFDIPKLDEDEMAFRCYCATGGLIGYLSNFLRQAVWNAIDSNSKVITLKDLRIAHKASVWVTERVGRQISPFSEKFQIASSDEHLLKAQEIGQALPPVVVGRIRVTKAMKSRELATL